MTTLRDERGMVLLLVLVVVALLSAIVVELGFSTLVDLRLTETFRDSTRSWYLAKGGVEAGRMILQADTNAYDHPSEPWGVGVPGYPVGEDGTVSIAFEDLGGRIDVNNLWNPVGRSTSSTWVRRAYDLFSDLGLAEPENLVAALVDWLDDDDVVATEIDLGDRGAVPAIGAESAYYRSLESPYGAANSALVMIDELAMIRGFDAETVATLAPYLSVHGGTKLNVNTAPLEVLLAWDESMTLQGAETIVAARETEPLESLETVRELVGVDVFSGLNRNGDIALKSETFRIEAQGMIGDGISRVTAVVGDSGRKTHYLKVH